MTIFLFVLLIVLVCSSIVFILTRKKSVQSGQRINSGQQININVNAQSIYHEWEKLNNKVLEYLRRGDYSNAEIYGLEALDWALKTNIVEITANSYSNLGQALFRQGKFYEAEQIYNKALELLSQLSNTQTKELSVAMIYGSIAQIKYNENDYQTAEYYFLKAIEIKEKYLSSTHPSLIQTKTNLHEMYRLIGRYK